MKHNPLKISWCAKKHKNIASSGKSQSAEIEPEMTKMIEKDLKSTIINMFSVLKDLKENINLLRRNRKDIFKKGTKYLKSIFHWVKLM